MRRCERIISFVAVIGVLLHAGLLVRHNGVMLNAAMDRLAFAFAGGVICYGGEAAQTGPDMPVPSGKMQHCPVCVGAADVTVTGRLGYLSEWEIAATVRPMATGRQTEFAGPLVIKHVGACTPNGVVEKSGEIRFRRIGMLSPKIEGVFTIENEHCTFETREATHDGVMKCPNKGGVPLALKVNY